MAPRNEAELAGVMAHEMGHVAAHHHGEALLTVSPIGKRP
jgi:predicted Zn-dependent protease